MDDFMASVLKARNESYQVALETAIRTGTSLVISRNGKVVKVKPPFKYELVALKPKRSIRKKTKK